MGPPQDQEAAAVPMMGVRARVTNWSRKRDIRDGIGPSVLDYPSDQLLENFQVSRRGLVQINRSSSEATISDLGSMDSDPVAVNAGATLTRGFGSLDRWPTSPPPISGTAVLSPSLQVAAQIARGDVVSISGHDCLGASDYSRDSDSPPRRKTEMSVLSRLRRQRTNKNEGPQGHGPSLTPHKCFSHHDVQSVLLTMTQPRSEPLGSSSEVPDLLPSLRHDELNDERRNALVLACPQFLNEIGGEMDLDLHPTRFCSLMTSAHSYHSKAAVSILEVPTEPQLGSSNLTEGFGLEYLDLGAKFYQKYFYNKDHQNFFGMDPQFGPVSLSIRREAVRDRRNQTQFSYRIILRTGQFSTLRGCIMEDSVPSSSKHGTSRGLPLKDVVEFVVPKLNTKSLRAASGSPRVQEMLLRLDHQELVLQHRVDLLLSRDGQNPGDQASSPALTQFLQLLRKSDQMKGDSLGSRCVYTTFQGFQLSFHVLASPPTPANETTEVPQILPGTTRMQRTRLVDYDAVRVIFQEPDAPTFHPQNTYPNLQCVFIVVRVHRPCTQHTRYSLAVSRSRGVPHFGPSFPSGWMFPASSAFVEFLLTKIINAQHAACRSKSLVTTAARARQEQLRQLVENFWTSTPLDCSSVRFNFISLGGKKKKKEERRVPRPLAHLQSAGALVWSVTVQDRSPSPAIACRLAVSAELLLLIAEEKGKVVFDCSCRDVIGWSALHGSIKLFHHSGSCVVFSTQGGWEDSEEITQRLQLVTQGFAALNMALRRNPIGQLGFHINSEGVVADVEERSSAWQVGLRPGCRLVEICSVSVATLSHQQMVELLRTTANVCALVLPPHRSFSEPHRLPLLEVKLESDGAPPTAGVSSNESPVNLWSTCDVKSQSRGSHDWFISSDESTYSTQDQTSRTNRGKETSHRCHPPPLLQPHVAKSCSSCSNTLSSNSSDGRARICLRGASMDSGIDSNQYMRSPPTQVASATLVLTDVLGERMAGHVTDFRSRRSSTDRTDRPHADSPETCPGECGRNADRLYSQDTCPWEARLTRVNRRAFLEDGGRPSYRPIREVSSGVKSKYRAFGVSASSPWKCLIRSWSHDSLSRTPPETASFLRRHHSASVIRCQQKGVSPTSTLVHKPMRLIQAGTPGTLKSDITASLSGKVSQLEEMLGLLHLDLLKVQQDKVTLQQEVLDLRQENVRLQQETRGAAEQSRHFTTWRQHRGSLP